MIRVTRMNVLKLLGKLTLMMVHSIGSSRAHSAQSISMGSATESGQTLTPYRRLMSRLLTLRVGLRSLMKCLRNLARGRTCLSPRARTRPCRRKASTSGKTHVVKRVNGAGLARQTQCTRRASMGWITSGPCRLTSPLS